MCPLSSPFLTSWCSADSADCAFNKVEFEMIMNSIVKLAFKKADSVSYKIVLTYITANHWTHTLSVTTAAEALALITLSGLILQPHPVTNVNEIPNYEEDFIFIFLYYTYLQTICDLVLVSKIISVEVVITADDST